VRQQRVSLEKQAKKAFELRNNAKELSRDVSGAELKAAAEANSASRYNGSTMGPSFDDLFQKNFEKYIK